jgi:hypothetical protein
MPAGLASTPASKRPVNQIIGFNLSRPYAVSVKQRARWQNRMAIPTRETLMTVQTAINAVRPVLDRAKLTGLKELIGEAKCEAAVQRFKGELFACVAAIEGNAPERAIHAHNLAGVAALLGFEDLEDKSRRFLVALHENSEEVRTSAESLLVAVQEVKRELDTIS